MNPEQQRIAIAEACGWTSFYALIPSKPTGLRHRGNPMWEDLPDYLSDLNAMHDCVAYLSEKHGWTFQKPYELALRTTVTRRRKGCNQEQVRFWMAEATAQQKAEAVLDSLAVLNAIAETQRHE